MAIAATTAEEKAVAGMIAGVVMRAAGHSGRSLPYWDVNRNDRRSRSSVKRSCLLFMVSIPQAFLSLPDTHTHWLRCGDRVCSRCRALSQTRSFSNLYFVPPFPSDTDTGTGYRTCTMFMRALP